MLTRRQHGNNCNVPRQQPNGEIEKKETYMSAGVEDAYMQTPQQQLLAEGPETVDRSHLL